MPRNSSRWKDLTGMRFGKLTATRHLGTSKWGHAIWLCHCDCGNDCETTSPLLLNGQKTNCGCDTQNKKDATRSAKTLMGQAKHGDYAGAMKGIGRIYSRG